MTGKYKLLLAAYVCLLSAIFLWKSGYFFPGGIPQTPVIIESISQVSQHLLWVEKIICDDYWRGAHGNVALGLAGGDYDPVPPDKVHSVRADAYPVPTSIAVRWFDFHKQRFYEGELHDSDLPVRALIAAAKRNPLHRYENMLIFAFGAKGEFHVWLRGKAYRSSDFSYLYTTDHLASGQARYAQGDPNMYKEMTEQARRQGIIPQEPLPSGDEKEKE